MGVSVCDSIGGCEGIYLHVYRWVEVSGCVSDIGKNHIAKNNLNLIRTKGYVKLF